MSIGVVNDEIFNREMAALGITQSIEQITNESVRNIVRGRRNKKETPEAIRALVATEKQAGAPSAELEKAFNVSKSSVSAYGNGATSTATYNKPDPAITDALTTAGNHIVGIAHNKLISALEAITDEKVTNLSANKAAMLARDMSSVVRNIKPPEQPVNINNNQVVIFRPRMKEEDDFEVIEVVGE